MFMKNVSFSRVKTSFASLLLITFSCFLPATRAAENNTAATAWEHSVVTVEIARKQYDYYQPWSKRTQRLQKTGIVVGDHQILTTADELFDRTLVRLQKGHGRWWIGEVAWLDYPANLALLTISDADFWRDLKPVALGGTPSVDSVLQVLRWREGKLENRRAEFTQFTVREGQLSPVEQPVLEASSEIQGVGWGEPLVIDSKVAGLVYAQAGRNCMVIPATFIRPILEAQKKGNYRGLGYFHFFWQPAENPNLLSRLKLPGEPRGVVVIEAPARPDLCEAVLQREDVILKVDGFDIDVQGDYTDPVFGPMLLENLATRGKWAGDDVKMQIWRDGKQLDVTYRLPKFQYTNSLVPTATYDQEPEYLIVGGLVFQPLTDSYLESWGADWKRRGPFRLNYYRNDPPRKERPGLILLSQVLPDPYNVGYQENKGLVLEKVNGQPVHRLSELQPALAKAENGFHVIEFAQGDSLRRLVLEAGDAETEATKRVLKRYGISSELRLSSSR